MRRELVVPKLGLTTTETTFVEWLRQPGQAFKAGESLFVVESEKAATEVPADGDGVLLSADAQAGQVLPVGAVLGWWDDGNGATAKAAAVPADAPARVPVTPLARRLACQRGIDLARVIGSGPRGRIRARDLPDAAPAAPRAPVAVPAPAPLAAAPAVGRLRAATPIEQTIARRLSAAKREIPHFYLAREAEVSALQALRAQYNALQRETRLTINHFIVAAVGRALQALPAVNRVWTDEGIHELAASDVGVAVDTPRGLLAPVLRDVGNQSLPELARLANAAAERARAGRLGADEMAGGAITVSNAGMHDVSWMTSIINPGQAMILGVGSVRELFRPDAEGRPALRREIGLVLSADHRVLDGVSALAFLRAVVDALQRPLALLVDA